MDLEVLMKAAVKFTDSEIKRDLEDCIVVLADSEEDAEQLLAYGAQRRKAQYFRPGDPGHNNHKFIKEQTAPAVATPTNGELCPISETDSGLGACRAKCETCGRSTYIRQNGTWARHTPPKR